MPPVNLRPDGYCDFASVPLNQLAFSLERIYLDERVKRDCIMVELIILQSHRFDCWAVNQKRDRVLTFSQDMGRILFKSELKRDGQSDWPIEIDVFPGTDHPDCIIKKRYGFWVPASRLKDLGRVMRECMHRQVSFDALYKGEITSCSLVANRVVTT
jgi:hypothetical protein